LTKALLFDLGNVLVAFDFARGYEAISGHTPVAPGEFPARIAATGLVPRFERGEISPEHFFEALSSALGLDLPYKHFCDLWSTIFLPDPLVPDELLARLHRRYRLVLISNTNAIHFQMIHRTYALLRHFDAFVLSYEVGAMKPDRHIYQAAVDRAGCRPEECFYTDDVPEFVDSGRRLGLDAVAFTGAADLERHLQERRLLD
jgi:putative hydrolase of the HAD superfamily